MKKTLFVLLIVLSLAGTCLCQFATWPWEVGPQQVPTNLSRVQGYAGNNTVHVMQATFVVNSAAPITVTISDNSTNCGGAACLLFSAVIGGSGSPTTYAIPVNGEAAVGGVSWSASATGVHGWIAGRY